MGSNKTKFSKNHDTLFKIYSNGVTTSRDAWAFNSFKKNLSENMKKTINYCNKQDDLDNPIIDDTQVKWSPGLTERLKKSEPKFDENNIRVSLYRPFFKQYLYYDDIFNERQAQISKIFPKENSKNIIIIVPKSHDSIPSTIITDTTPEYSVIATGKCFPLYKYENDRQQSNVTEYVLEKYKKYYNDKTISKEAIFYYVYGLLHHDGYKTKYKNNLQKEIPRIPMAPDFKKFVTAGRRLAKLHLNYETCKKYPLKPKAKFGKLTKMSFGKTEKNGKKIEDKTKLMINGTIIFENLPIIKYTVNGKTPLEWVIENYNKDRFNESQKKYNIINDPTENMTFQETIDKVQRMIYIGVESDKIIKKLSKEEFESKKPTSKKKS